MYIVHVNIHVHARFIEPFKSISIENARKSRQEPGIARFDVLQDENDSSHFEFLEVYRTQKDPAKHKETSHYNKWRELAEPMLIEPRARTVYINIDPSDQGW
jgi:(4S)-4-hydroxy-5-phosphonooxypentane-2,3-dione isomerase